ncbi:hypothetical protein [Streptomyces chartreusis]|uniref:hypothetical protein n=1 Tax=Streptomyces chartreusis TaxID=1969 RepID=UPI0033CE9DFB
MENKSRGSDELLEAYRKSGFRIDEQLVESIAEKINGFDLNDILVKGQPRPDFLRAIISAGDSARTGMLTADLLDAFSGHAPGLPATIRIFPKGIPWPGEFMVDITIAERR